MGMQLYEFLDKFIEMKDTTIYIDNLTDNISDYYSLEELEEYEEYEVEDFTVLMEENRLLITIKKGLL